MGTPLRNLTRGRSKIHSDDEHGPVSPQKPSAPGYVCRQRRTSKRVATMVLLHAQILEPLETTRRTRQIPTEWKVDSLPKGQEQGQRKTSTMEKALAEMWIQTRVSIAASPDIGQETAESQAEEHTTAPTVVSTKAKARASRKDGARGRQWTLCTQKYLLLDSVSRFTRIRLNIQEKKVSLTDPGIPHSERNTTQTRRWTFGQIHASRRTNDPSSLSCVAMCRNPLFPSVVLQNRSIGVIFALTLAHCTFQTSRQQSDSITQ